MCPLTFCRKESTMCLLTVCHELAKSPLRWWNKEGDKSATRRINILNSLKRRGWTRRQAISNLEDIIALSPKLKLGCRWGARRNWPHFSQPKTYSHCSWRHHLARRRRGQGWHDSMHPCVNQSPIKGWLPTKPWRPWLWLQDDVPKPLEMKPACKY
jgi:hypothetical protein